MHDQVRPAPRRRLLLLALVLVLVAATAVAGVVWWRGRGGELARAVSLAPSATERVSWVDWSGVRRELADDLGGEPGPDSSPAELQALLDAAFEADLSATSVLVQSGRALQRLVGLSPASVTWEAYAQGPDGALLTMGAEGLDLGAVGDDLEELGFTRPEDDDGVWIGGVDLLARADPSLTPQVSFVALLEDEQLVLASDEAAYVEGGVDAVRGDAERGLPDLEVVADALSADLDDASDPLAASLLTGSNACGSLAMAQADDAAQAEADALVEAAGEVHPYTAIGTALLPGGDARVAMTFENGDQARTDADTRARLASGPAPGQGGDFADRFTLAETRASDRTVVMELEPLEGSFVLSDLSTGPVLYATC